jgi:hypothetical protein
MKNGLGIFFGLLMGLLFSWLFPVKVGSQKSKLTK